MRTADPKEAERMRRHVDDILKKYPNLPMSFKKEAIDTARSHECSANMRATNSTLDKALVMAQSRKTSERTRLLGEARKYYGRALMCGAEKEFQLAADRMMNAIMLTTAPDMAKPTRAKPLATAPTNPRCAKC
ncbi:MAG: hypothetical protein H7840_15905 [Alphaproteobacteria bacterium]